MTRHGDELGATELQSLFAELSNRLQDQGLHAQLFVVGGAAMALAYDGSRATRDVDAVFAPVAEVRDIAAKMGLEHGLEPDWINDAAKGFMPGPDDDPTIVFESNSLIVQVPSPEYLLAMKLFSMRGERDINDAATLYNVIGYTTPEQGRELLSRTYPLSLLLPKHRYVVEEVAQRASDKRASNDALRERLSRLPGFGERPDLRPRTDTPTPIIRRPPSGGDLHRGQTHR
jgi:hypothetical protein